MTLAADRADLAALAARILSTRDGRAHWRPMRECIRRLHERGASPQIAYLCAHAVASVAAQARETSLLRPVDDDGFARPAAMSAGLLLSDPIA